VTATIHVGPLQPSHRQRIEEIVRSTGVFSDEEIRVALQLFDTDIGHRTPDAAYEFVGAFEGDQLVGYVCFGATPSTDRTFDLYWIAVHPDSQRAGVGGVLMSELERMLRDRRARLVVVETSSRDDYSATRRFYQKRGFQETARLRDFYAPGDDRIVLTKRVGVHQTILV
jgi:ribosomal protein S18 acetylase RimI-like enzyme